MKNIIILSDKNKKSQSIRSKITKLIKNKKILNQNVSIVIGGDGFMLQILKKNKNSKNFFYGVNSGNYGFLMNKFSKKHTIKNLLKTNLVTINPLEMIVKNKIIKKYM